MLSESRSPLARLARVRAQLTDDASQAVFDARVKHLVTGEFAPMMDLADSGVVPTLDGFRWSEYLTAVAEHARTRRLVIYGAGGEGEQLRLILQQVAGITPFAFCDRNFGLTRSIPVIPPSQATATYRADGDVTFLLGSEMFFDEMRDALLAEGVSTEHILGGRADVSRQYFDPDVVTLREHEVFVDGGALDLATSRALLRLQGSHGRTAECIAFEPDRHNVERIRALQGIDNIKLVPCGLWSGRTTLSFDSTSNGSSHLNESGSQSIDVCDLDSYLDGAAVSFIKLDIEGAELEALRGARRTLRTHQPTVAVSVYHRYSDLPEIPELLAKELQGHRWHLRHYSIYPAETVLYAQP